MLTYMEVHLYFTLPLLAILMLVHKPFTSTLTNFKLLFLCMVAMTTASIWDNYIVYHNAWWYCPTCVIAVIGYVPLEEYMFFIIMTVITVHFTSLVMRWQLPVLSINPSTSKLTCDLSRYVPFFGLMGLGIVSWFWAIPNTPFFYGCCILFYTLPVLAVLWYGSGLYIARRFKAVMVSVMVPTALLCIVDIVALRAGVWHINEKTSTEIFVVPDLPLEEFGFFLLVNTVIVFACCAIDRTNAIIHTFPYLYSKDADVQMDVQNTFSLTYLSALLTCFTYQDNELPLQPIQDLKSSLQVLSQASKSFTTASAAFSFDVRQDLCILYGFCRATDEIADGEGSLSDRQERLTFLIEFIDTLFSQPHYGLSSPLPSYIEWDKYAHLPGDVLAMFRAVSRMVHYLPRKPFDELIDGYTWDIKGRTVENQEDLLRYCNNVASSVGDLCTAVIMYRTGRGNWRLGEYRSEWIIKRAREMGQVLQLVNIARDIVTDSQTLGRCYIPLTYLQDPMMELDLLNHGKARHISDGNLRRYALRILALADKLAVSGSRGIDLLPMEARRGVWAACQVYSGIGKKLREQHGYPSRAHLNTWERCWVALRCLYGLHQKTTNTRSRMTIWKIY
ncbi:hypothetical protein K450DRAFT_185497 [Umbelopsis ramanniana AG]|uniref:Bifunctional lycopene cyclase/phytoene synthase n=1 Tax=Umbelopsis ramanniana AG TaxID=1314678 RepID=A0AAD5EE86_UMBRA|nr:uncharacterized protein K450DRAFT_185497 [Umbelopsis ramanniana AG]KAI8581712.1 hypothetical protein K450DRAFT_185497 [Umbelopsis ramanniana AG]